ncbi:MAG: type II secretion system protein GspG [Thermoanaerobaculia bacterium]
MKKLAVITLILAASAFAQNDDKKNVNHVLADLRTLAAVVEAYAADYNHYPLAKSMAELKPLVEPIYVKPFVGPDPWGNAYRYLVSEDGKHYRFVCAAADGKFQPEFEKMTNEPPAQLTTSNPTDDIVYQDNAFRRVPEGFEKAFLLHEERRANF